MIEKNIEAFLKNENLIEYCNFYSIDVNDAKKDSSTIAYMQKEQGNLEMLISGYVEMGHLNREICSEFWNCECSLEHMPEFEEG